MAQEAEAAGALVRAAGCVLWRYVNGSDGSADAIEVGLVHRPRYHDWSHPKGKLHEGESPAQAAVREVLEETGMRCVLGTELPTARYRARGLPKEVHYWTAEAVAGAFEPNDEVDQLLWLSLKRARDQLSHEADRTLLDTAALTLPAG